MAELLVGDRAIIFGGYDGDESAWLGGGPGYAGTIIAMNGSAAAVELDSELRFGAGG